MENEKLEGYWIEEVDDPTFFPGHAAAVMLSLGGKRHEIGRVGILHPTVLKYYELP